MSDTSNISGVAQKNKHEREKINTKGEKDEKNI
jgi:hypothetical protein